MNEVGGIAFTIAIATVIVLFYLVYNVLFKESSASIGSEADSTDNNNVKSISFYQ